jgi:Fe-S-cluster containining protein
MGEDIDAGIFASWLRETEAMLRGTGGADVPCGSCVGCCVSSYYIWLRPEDRVAYDEVPEEFLLRGRDQPAGHHLMGYREDGRCPMQTASGCRIYADRPQTCRDYDCRIFAAAGIEAGGDEKRVINERIRAWRFRHAGDADRASQAAIAAAAAFIQANAPAFVSKAPTAPTGIAVLALKAHRVFLDPAVESCDAAEIARRITEASRAFDAKQGSPT